VIARLKELDAILRHNVNQSMLLSKTPGPGSGSQILQRLRLPNPSEFVEPELTAEFFERLRFQFPALSSRQRSEKPLSVLW
jgi:hypothetical protein